MKVSGLFGSLAFLAVLAFTSGVKIECLFGQYTSDWDDIGSWYSCFATVVSTDNPATVTSISGSHSEGNRNEDVKQITVQSEYMLHAIPAGIEAYFPNLESIQWLPGGLTTIDSNTLKPFPNLIHLKLNYNHLVSLDGNLFQHTRRLRTIDFGSNLLEHIGHDLLTGLPELTVAYFYGNPCINLSAYYGSLEVEELSLELSIQCPPKEA